MAVMTGAVEEAGIILKTAGIQSTGNFLKIAIMDEDIAAMTILSTNARNIIGTKTTIPLKTMTGEKIMIMTSYQKGSTAAAAAIDKR